MNQELKDIEEFVKKLEENWDKILEKLGSRKKDFLEKFKSIVLKLKEKKISMQEFISEAEKLIEEYPDLYEIIYPNVVKIGKYEARPPTAILDETTKIGKIPEPKPKDEPIITEFENRIINLIEK